MITPEEARCNVDLCIENILNNIDVEITMASEVGKCKTKYPIDDKSMRKKVIKYLKECGYKARQMCELSAWDGKRQDYVEIEW